MTNTLFIKISDYQPVEAGIYTATISKVAVVENPFFDQEKEEDYRKQQLELVYTFLHKDKETEMKQWISMVYNPKSNFYQLARALGISKSKIENNELTIEEVLSKKVRIKISKEIKDGKTLNRVKEIIPL